MPFPKYAAFFTGLLLTAFMLPAQKARYADSYVGNDVRIPGLIKNAIHVWSASSHLDGFNSRNITLTLHIFSTDMQLMSERPFRLGWINYWTMTFHYADTCYYADIVYGDLKQKRLLLKIDQSGNFTDISTMPAIWPNNFIADEKNMFYASAGNKDNLYSVQIEHVPAGDSSATDGIRALPGENFTASIPFEKLTIKKLNRTTHGWTKQEYGTNYKRLSNPHISVNDTALLVTAMAEAAMRINLDTITETSLRIKLNTVAKDPWLLVARFDTSLSDAGARIALLTNVNDKNTDRFTPVAVFALKKNILLLSKGLHQGEPIHYIPLNQDGTPGKTERVLNLYTRTSLKITVFDEKNRLLKDTILEDNGSAIWDNSNNLSTPGMVHFFCIKRYTNNKSGILHVSITADGTIEQQVLILEDKVRLIWDNSISFPTPGMVHFFCIKKYTYSKSGILHISIAADGTTEQQDVIVDPRFNYNLYAAKQLQQGQLLVPYVIHRSKTGLLQLFY